MRYKRNSVAYFFDRRLRPQEPDVFSRSSADQLRQEGNSNVMKMKLSSLFSCIFVLHHRTLLCVMSCVQAKPVGYLCQECGMDNILFNLEVFTTLGITNAVTLCSGPTVSFLWAAYIFLADIYGPLRGPMRLRLHVRLAKLCFSFTNTEGSEACTRLISSSSCSLLSYRNVRIYFMVTKCIS